MRRLEVSGKVPEARIKPWKGKHPRRNHWKRTITADSAVYSEGKLVVAALRGQVSGKALDAARPTLYWMERFKSDGRASYAGHRARMGTKKDGTKERQLRAYTEDGERVSVSSAIAGYMTPQGGRLPYCRKTGFLRQYPERWATIEPALREIGRSFERHFPERYAAQMDYVNRSHQAWVIGGTPFTTITVNNTVPAAYHQDSGDLKEGLGCMLVLREGSYRGFELVVPEYGIAVDLKDGDLLFFDPTIWHGNRKPFDTIGKKNEAWRRTSVVCYYRKGILGCESPDGELAKMKARS